MRTFPKLTTITMPLCEGVHRISPNAIAVLPPFRGILSANKCKFARRTPNQSMASFPLRVIKMKFHCNYRFEFPTPRESESAYTCKVDEISESHLGPGIDFIGEHEPRTGQTRFDVERFEISGLHVESFPRNVHVKFPNLVNVCIESCGLKKISREDFIGLENLEYLELKNNKLEALPNNLFDGMSKLQWVDFYDNRLKRFSSELLEPVEKSLKYADFRANRKIDDYFDSQEPGKDDLRRLMDVMGSPEFLFPDRLELIAFKVVRQMHLEIPDCAVVTLDAIRSIAAITSSTSCR